MSSNEFDMSMMLISHDAFRRDIGHLRRAAERNDTAEPERRRAVHNGWQMFKLQIGNHHTNEDKSIWPRMRDGLHGRPDDLAVLDAMESEHEHLDPLLAAVDDAFAQGMPSNEAFAQAIATLDTSLLGHLDHEEHDALPLVPTSVTPGDWKQAANDMRDLIGLKGAADFFPWLLDGAPDKDVDQILKMMPMPARIMYRKMWVPKYAKTARWA